jgi:DNA-binding XRE family transcriptional regulator
VMIRNRFNGPEEQVQTELWGPVKWDRVYIQPGAYARHAIERGGAEFLIRSRRLFALDDYRHRAVKLLGQSIENLLRINARTGPAIRLRVSTLLGYADIGDNNPRPGDREALESALDKLVEIEVLSGWQYAGGFAVDDKVRQRMTARRIEEWRESLVEIEAAHAVARQYAPIAQKAIVHADKDRQRTERAVRKAEQTKAPPAGMGAELRALRTRIGASVLVAGERIGISAASVSRIENGAKVSEQVAAKVREWLKTAG